MTTEIVMTAASLVTEPALPVIFEKDRRRRAIVYLVVALAGVGGVFGSVLLRSLIVSIA
ncbi:MAG: hypothetical protein WB297_05980 [Actinomycetota bacterium]